MNSFEASVFSSTSTFSNAGNGFEASTSSSSSTVVANSNSPSKLSFDLVIGYIDDILSAITNKKSHAKMLDCGKKLKDMVEPLALDFSKLCEGISQGAKMFSDQKFFTNNLSSEAHTMAIDVLKGVGNAHWAAVGLLAIANVLERMDKISTNDRECIDLLKGLLDLTKYIKMVKDINADFHREILGKMSEALHLIVSGAILCHSFIRCNKISKFLSTKKISEELVYLRGKVDRMKIDMVLQMNYMFVSSVTFHLSREQHRTSIDGDRRQQQQNTDDTGEMPETFEIKTHTIASQTLHVEPLSPQSVNLNNSNKKKGFRAWLIRTFLAFGGHLISTANGFRNITVHKFEGCGKPVHTLSMSEPSSLFSLEIDRVFTIKELERATKGFQEMLGQGGFGYTYRGTLSDGRRVVVKRSRDKSSALQRELECIKNLQHPNILNLVGSCIAGDELLLVYDYMPNGNLSNLLFNQTESVVLDWPTRWNIIQGVIDALVYLHEGADECIVHRDIKPTNILLDGNFNAKVADFGIARILPKRKSGRISTIEEEGVYIDFEEDSGDTHHSTGAAGTVGYVAPECIMTGHVTRAADIYSFGLLLLNIVSGRRCLEFSSISDGIRSLIKLAWKLEKEDRLIELIDPRLLKTRGFHEKNILKTIVAGLLCIQMEPTHRPIASQLLKMKATIGSRSQQYFKD